MPRAASLCGYAVAVQIRGNLAEGLSVPAPVEHTLDDRSLGRCFYETPTLTLPAIRHLARCAAHAGSPSLARAVTRNPGQLPPEIV